MRKDILNELKYASILLQNSFHSPSEIIDLKEYGYVLSYSNVLASISMITLSCDMMKILKKKSKKKSISQLKREKEMKKEKTFMQNDTERIAFQSHT